MVAHAFNLSIPEAGGSVFKVSLVYKTGQPPKLHRALFKKKKGKIYITVTPGEVHDIEVVKYITVELVKQN